MKTGRLHRLLVPALVALGSYDAFAQAPQTQAPAPARGGAIQSVEDRTSGMRKIDGYFPLYWEERTGLLFLEIPRFDADFLFSTGLSAGLGSNDIGLDRGAGGQGKVVHFQRVGPKVFLVQPNQSFRSSSSNPRGRRVPGGGVGCWRRAFLILLPRVMCVLSRRRFGSERHSDVVEQVLDAQVGAGVQGATQTPSRL